MSELRLRDAVLLELGDWDGQVERYYLAHYEAFDPTLRLTREQLNAEYVTAAQWWAPTELETADVRFAPRRLPLLVRELSMHGAPAEPIDAGV